MSLLQQYEQAVKEFGKHAYNRLEIDQSWVQRRDFNSTGNYTVECALKETLDCLVTIKQNNELIAHDIEWYGEDAYLMWELYLGGGSWDDVSCIESLRLAQCDPNCSTHLRRKTNAPQPFDIERAKAGDAVEVVISGTDEIMSVNDAIDIMWEKNNLHPCEKPGDYLSYTTLDYWSQVIDIFSWERLRMEYPKKATK